MKKEKTAFTIRYEYDSLDRLKTAVFNQHSAISYDYDAVGNLTIMSNVSDYGRNMSNEHPTEQLIEQSFDQSMKPSIQQSFKQNIEQPIQQTIDLPIDQVPEPLLAQSTDTSPLQTQAITKELSSAKDANLETDEKVMYCTNCGAKIPFSTKFCLACGKKLG